VFHIEARRGPVRTYRASLSGGDAGVGRKEVIGDLCRVLEGEVLRE
jgi:hypothetical protein